MSHICISDRFIASPSAQSLHIHPGVARRAQPNAVLEKVFTSITKVLFSFFFSSYRVAFVIFSAISSWMELFSPLVHAESRFSPSGRPFQAAGLGGAKGPALVQTPQEPRQTKHTHQILREHVGPCLLSSPLTSLQAWEHNSFVFSLCMSVCTWLFISTIKFII